MELFLIIIGIGLIIGAFVTAWMVWQVADSMEKEKKKKLGNGK